MPNLYIIAVGGTGVKCLESFIHLCAMGMVGTTGNTDAIKVIVVDPDSANGNVSRFSTLFSTYNAYRNLVRSTKQNELPGFSVAFEGGMNADKQNLMVHDIIWNPAENLNSTLDDYVNSQRGDQELDRQQKLLINSLFEQSERDERLEQGFRGHPSIGSLFISSKFDLEDGFWQQYFGQGSNFESRLAQREDTRVFVVGSIFGGTGAAGVPTIARILKDAYPAYVKNRVLKIGIGMMLPYFNFERPGKQSEERLRAESKEFIPNTKFALNYYRDSGILKELTDIFLIGSEPYMIDSQYYAEGGSNQSNASYATEIVSALTMRHFFSTDYVNVNNLTIVPRHKTTSNKQFEWGEFPDGNNGQVFNQKLYSMVLYSLYWSNIFRPTMMRIRAGMLPENEYTWYKEFFGNYPNNKFETDINLVTDYHNLFINWVEQCFAQTDILDANLLADMCSKNSWDYGKKDALILKGVSAGKIKSDKVVQDLQHSKKADQDNGLAAFLHQLYKAAKV